MADTIDDVAAAEQVPVEPARPVDQQQLAERLLRRRRNKGSSWSARTFRARISHAA